MNRTMILTGAALALAGCAPSEPSPEIAAAPRRELLSGPKATIASAIAIKMKDPDAAKFMWPPLIMAQRSDGATDYCVWVNGKNSFGGYVGFYPTYVQLAFDGKGGVAAVDVRAIGGPPDDYGFDTAASVCHERGYQMPGR